ncbi:MAG: class I SAM-dependent methyltransferase [Burkholderiales bacterium]|nr:class I SAM-dependent methyltransferase [Burkholderiales bacterium]
MTRKKLRSIAQACLSAHRLGVGGRFVEAGCALGGSTVVIANLLPRQSDLYVYDTFAGRPPPTERDSADVHERYKIISSGKSIGINGSTYYGYRYDLFESVTKTISTRVPEWQSRRVHLVKGLVQDTLPDDQSVAFAHVDVDWYDPVAVCTRRIFPQLVVGGSIIFDDYLDYASCKNAVDEYFSQFNDKVCIDTSAGSCRVTKLRE